MKANNTSFFPLYRSIKTDSCDGGEAHKEREVQVKDLDDMKVSFKDVSENNTQIYKAEQAVQSDLRSLRETILQSTTKVQQLQAMLLANDEDQDKKKKKKKGAQLSIATSVQQIDVLIMIQRAHCQKQ